MHIKTAITRISLTSKKYLWSGLNLLQCFKFSSKHKLGVLQICSREETEKNFTQNQSLIEEAAQRGAEMVFLPENFHFMGKSIADHVNKGEDLDGPTIKRYGEIAKKANVWLSLGGFLEKSKDNWSKVYNTHIILDNNGDKVSVYRKIHLFDVVLSSKVSVMESKFTEAGSHIVPPVSTPIGKLGLTICYDIRFPELFRYLSMTGAEVIATPSAFLVKTGAAHWETLNKCRAIDHQCWIVSSCQAGFHNEKRSSYGHAMVVSPWGVVTSGMDEEIGVQITEIDLDMVGEVKKRIPMLDHVRMDCYYPVLNDTKDKII